MQINIPKENDYTEKREKESKRFPYTGRSYRIASNYLANGVVSLFTAVYCATQNTPRTCSDNMELDVYVT